MKHEALSPVCLGLLTIFGTKCSCGCIHPSIINIGVTDVDTTQIWCAKCNGFVQIDFSDNPKVSNLTVCQCKIGEFKKSNWGMTAI